MLEASSSVLISTPSAVIHPKNFVDSLSQPGTALGLLIGSSITFFFSLVTLLINDWLTKRREKVNRRESFRSKAYELRIQAAQTAYQYIFKINRSLPSTTQRGQMIIVNKPKVYTSELLKEARDWLDGQALILGDKVYQAVFFYFNSVGDKGQYQAMNDAINALKKIIKEDLISLD